MLQTENAGWTSRHTRAWGCRESGTVPADPTTKHLTQDDEEETDYDNVHHELSRLHLLVCMEKKSGLVVQVAKRLIRDELSTCNGDKRHECLLD